MTPRAIQTRRVALALFALASLAYLAWRAAGTITPGARAWAWTFWALEAYAAWSSFAFYLIVLHRRDPEPSAPARSYRVDVLICTYNESPALLRQTVRRALAMTYPHRTWVLDDGRRAEVREMARSLDCGYLARERNEDYKAGNLNHALSRTHGDLVVVLDADHLVRPEFLDRLVGYFDDPRVALVQTPQVFYNLDSFQHHFRPGTRRLWHEGAVFHHAMQPGLHRWNAAFFSGSGAVLRRSALVSVGGFARGSVTEDIFTSMRLHAAGWASVYHDEPLGYLLAPDSLEQYLTQRLRWGQGAMQILRAENPLAKRGLSPWQRFAYFTALSGFAQSAVHLAYYLAPAIYLLGGPAPLSLASPWGFAVLLGHIAFDVGALYFFLGPLGRIGLAECYKLLNVFIYLRSVGGYFRGAGRLAFRVTTKGRDARVPRRLLAPQIALMVLNGTAFGFGVIRLSQPAAGPVEWLGNLLATGFALYFVVAGGSTLLYARTRIGARSEYTFADALRVRLSLPGGGTLAGAALRVSANEIYVQGGPGVRAAPGTETRVELDVDDGGAPLVQSGRVERTEHADGGSLLHVSFDHPADEAADRLFDHFVHCSIPAMLSRVAGYRATSAAGHTPHAPDTYLEVQARVL